MLAAIWATWASECVRGFLAKGIRRSMGHNSIRLANSGATVVSMHAGDFDLGRDMRFTRCP